MMISIVVPAFNEEQRIRRTLESLLDVLPGLSREFEIVVVDDGSTDRTAAVAGGIVNPAIRLIRLAENRGKGAALKEGLGKTRGDIVFFADADLPYSPRFFSEALERFASTDCGAVIGARDLPGSFRDPSFPLARVLVGKAFSYVVNWILPLGIFDTQCGFKAFKADLLKSTARFTREEGYMLDIELLLILRTWGTVIEKLPVRLVNYHGSKIRIIRDSIAMLQGLLRIARRRRKGLYPPVWPEEEK